MSMTSIELGAFSTPEELARGKREVAVSLLVAVAAAVLAALASGTTDAKGLVVVYLVAAALHFGAGVCASIRWSRTPEFDTTG